MRSRIADEQRWTTDFWARSKSGAAVPPYSHDATCWCVEGAALAEGLPLTPFCFAVAGRSSLAKVNDTDGHAAVLGILDAAIARLETAS
ncbi:MAG TPA: hypothetical protein VGB14_06120 [Acidimicrobiales bacterium]